MNRKCIVFIIAMFLIISNGSHANAITPRYMYTNTDVLFKTTCNGMNVSDPLYKGLKVEVVAIGEVWTKVSLKGELGFIRTAFLQKNAPISKWNHERYDAKVIAKSEIFTWYYGKTKKIKTLNVGKVIHVTGVNPKSKYLRIAFGNNICYIPKNNVKR